MYRIRTKLLVIALVLIAVGIIMIFSSSAIYAFDRFGDSAYFLKKHLVFLLIGLLFSLGVLAVDINSVKRHSNIIFALSLTLLFIVLIPHIGSSAAGARRWIRLGSFGFQPSEFAKLAIIIFTAAHLSNKSALNRQDIMTFAKPILALFIFAGLILIQPDLGSTVLIICVVFVMFFVGGMGMRYVLAGFITMLPFIFVLIFTSAYRLKRIMAFVNPWKDPQGTGFQMVQSFLALGSGGLFGVGLGHSKQKLFYLPASHTDFIFSIIGEELGFLGAAAIVILFILFIRYAAKVILATDDNFSKLLGFGLVMMVALEAIVNVAVTTGSMPTKGLPLPFISYGGSNLILNMVSVAFLLNIAKRCE